MKRTPLARTELRQIEPIGKAVRDHALLHLLISEKLSPDAAKMLAIPEIAADGAAINWYAEGLVSPVRLDKLPDEQKTEVRQRVAGFARDLERLAAETEGRGGSENRETAAMLRDLTTLPDESFIFVIDGRPVLSAWSCVRVNGDHFRAAYSVTGAGVPRAVPAKAISEIHEPVPEPPPPPEAVPPAAIIPVEPVVHRSPWWSWLLWLLLALLIAAIMALLLRACALAPLTRWFGLPNACATATAAAPDLAQLQLIADDLEFQIRAAAENCAARVPATSDEDVIAEAESRTRDLQRGALEIALIWGTEDDLDLRVEFECPATGEMTVIGFREKGLEICGGMLDQDANVQGITQSPAEHIVWPDGAGIPPGPMNVIVSYYKDNPPSSATTAYQVVIKKEGEEPQVIEGALAPRKGKIAATLQN